MTDTVQPPPAPAVGANTHKWFGGIITAFGIGVVIYLILWGKGDNSLHTSAMSWAFCLIGVVLASFGFPAAVQLLTSKLK